MVEKNSKLSNINALAKAPEDFVKKCEDRYDGVIDGIVDRVTADEGREIIMLAGPSSAGKTTTAKKMREKLTEKGITTYVLSLDDFYFNREDIPVLPDGTQDFETVHALDLDCFEKTINALLRGETVKAPVFDFTTGKRRDDLFNEITLGEKDAVIIEGLHALNPLITEHIEGKLLKVFINISTRIYDEDGNLLLNKRNLRLIRRMIRDYKFRSSTVENTFRLWQIVLAGEDKYLFPYRHNADVKADTTHLYESCVLKHQALSMLYESADSKEFGDEIKRLITALESFCDIDEALVPDNSLLREFLGQRTEAE